MSGLNAVVHQLMKEKRDVILSVVFGFIAGIAAVGLFTASGYLISQAALSVPIYALTVVIAIVKLLGFTRAIARYVERYVSHRATFTMLSHIRVSFFEKLQQLSPATLRRFRSGDLLSRFVSDVESLQNFFLRIFYPPVVLVLIFLSTVLFTMYFSVWLAILLVIGILLSTVALPVLFSILHKRTEQTILKQQSELSSQATELLFGFQDLKIHQQFSVKERAFKQSNEQYVNTQARERGHELVNHILDGWVGLFMGWSVLALSSLLVAGGQLEGVWLAMLMLLTLTVFENTTPMAAFPQYWQDNKEAAGRVFFKNDKKQAPLQQLANDGAMEVTFNNVKFTYPEELRPTLHDISLTIPAGSQTAIIGASGSGKSTVLQLILGLEQATAGEITLTGKPVDTLAVDSIWQQTNTVLQDRHFFSGTIRDNLLSDQNDQHLTEVLRRAQLGAFSLDDPVHEKGDNLSGGEKQRLALARTLLRDANLWLLDEPTSSLDRVTARTVMDEVLQASHGKTLVYVSHNLQGLDMMEQIIVLDHGRIVEQGTYAELMDAQHTFYRLKHIEEDMLYD